MTEVDDIALAEAPYGSDLYAQAVKLREAMLRKPLGLTLSQEELTDDALRRHFCALTNGTVVGSVSFKPLGPHTLQLKQMAVADGRQGNGVGSRLLRLAQDTTTDALQLWAFQSNTRARVFYERRGFVELRRTDGDNEEREPDILYRWEPD